MRFWLPALVVIAVASASAHHPFTPYYDASRPGSITGPIVELRAVRPVVIEAARRAAEMGAERVRALRSSLVRGWAPETS